MTPKVITPRASPVIAVADLKAHLRVTHASEDTLIASYLEQACAWAQNYSQVTIGPQTLELALDAFPTGAIELPYGLVTALTSVKYRDTAGTLITLDPSNYALNDYADPAVCHLTYGSTWPQTREITNAVLVRYAAGATALHDGIRSALLLTVGHLYANRESVNVGNIVSKMPLSAEAMLDSVKIWSM